jgi:hypothetical protein
MAPFSKLSALLHKDGSNPSSRRASTVSTSSLNPSEQDLTDPHPSHPDVSQGIAASPAAAYKQQVVQGETFSGGYRDAEDDLETPTLERGPGISVFPPAGNGLQYQAMGTGTGAGTGDNTPLATQRGEVIMAPPIPMDITAGGGGLMGVPQQGTEARPRSPSIQIVPAGLPATPVKNVPIVHTQGELHVTPNETGSILSAKRKSSSASGTRSVRSSVIGTTGTGTTVGTGSTTTLMETPTKSVNLVPPHSPHTVASIHTPADLIHKVKAKVKNRRGSRSSRRSMMGDPAVDEGDSTVTGHTSKRARLKNRLRALSDGSSIHPDHEHEHDNEYDDEDDEEDDDLDESDTTEDDDSDADARTTRSSISRMSLPVTGFAVASNKRNLEFHTLFNQIDEGDYLIEGEPCAGHYGPPLVPSSCDVRRYRLAFNAVRCTSDYGCALQKDILVHGRIYVSEHHLSFHSNILGWVTDVSRVRAFVVVVGQTG